jgi:PTS system mannose-specific IIA component
MIKGLIVTHGGFGAELVKVVGQILGPQPDLTCLSNQGRSAKDLSEQIRNWLQTAEPHEGIVVFVDDYGGSCASSAQLACVQNPRVVILSGVNLAMLLGFLTWRETLALPDLAQKLVQKGREAIARIGSPPKDGAAR